MSLDLTKCLPDGNGVWIHDTKSCLGGDIQAIAAQLKAAGVTVIFLKSDDGGRWYDQKVLVDGVLQSAAWWWIAFQFQKAGFKVWAWGYHMGGEPGQQYTANGQVYDSTLGYKAEATIAGETITYRDASEPTYSGPDGYVFDAEDEYAGRASQAAYVVSTVRAACGPDFPLAYAPIGYPQGHVNDPYYQFNAGCDLCLPQCYDSMFKNPSGPDWSVREFGLAVPKYGLDKPWFPIYSDVPGGFEPSAGDFTTWITTALSSQSKPRFVSVWVLDELSSAGLGRVKQINAQLAPAPTPKPTPIPKPVPMPCTDLINAVHGAVGLLTAALPK